MNNSGRFERIATQVAHFAGKPGTFAACCFLILGWALSGPVFGFSDTWQLIINTSTTIVTFLMVFLIQNTQNRDGIAIQTKLDELIRVSEARNRFVGIERLTEEEIDHLRQTCEARARREGGTEHDDMPSLVEQDIEARKAVEKKVKISVRRALRH